MLSKLPLAVLLFEVACTGGLVSSIDDVPAAPRAKAPDAMWRALVAQEPRSFIVALSPTVTDTAAWSRHKAQVLAAAPAGESAVEADWDQLPLIQVRATTADAALAVLDHDNVAAAYEIERYQINDAESFPLIGQPAAVAAGKAGAGTSVAVLDTGTDYTRADFGSCTAPGTPSTCRVAYAADIAADDGSRDANGHGTNVAGIIAGLAPATRVLALDVFTGDGAYSTDIITAVNWALANKRVYNIAALNLSLGGGSSTTPCQSDAMGIALGAARNAGIAPVVASGNNGYTAALSSPACAPAAISVGAVYDANLGGLRYGACSDLTTAADQITCFSNSASFLTVLAPGALITAAGYTMAGTSQATPHVAGALAILRGAFPTETVDQLVARLTSTGKKIRDARNGITTPRIDVAAALGTGGDVKPPTGSVAINGGAAATRTAAVALAITGRDDSGVAAMCVSNTAVCTEFVPFAASKPWTLAAGDGKKTVTVFLRDAVGNTTTATTSPSAAITLDTTPPVDGSVTATAASAQVALRWSGFTDAGTAVASYRVVAAAGTAPPAGCTGTVVYSGGDTSRTVTGLVNGTAYSFRVCAVDGAGNTSAGATASATPRAPTPPPTGTLQISGGARFTRTLAVALALQATGDGRVTQMCITEAVSCTSYVAFAATANYTFAAGDGARTLRAWFRDANGATSVAAAVATITVDTTPPSGGTLTSAVEVARIKLTWTPPTDAGSGVAGYKLVGATGLTPPAAGCTGTALYSGPAAAFSHAVAAGATWSYRLCALDGAGNVAPGITRTATAR